MSYILQEIAYYPIFDRPLVLYLGLLTLLSFLLTAYVGYAIIHNIRQIPFRRHTLLAKISLGLAFIHALLASSPYL